jgi:hypothetical protein
MLQVLAAIDHLEKYRCLAVWQSEMPIQSLMVEDKSECQAV